MSIPSESGGAAVICDLHGVVTPVNATEPIVAPLPVDDAPNRTYEEQAQEVENLYRTAPVGLALMDRSFRFLRINERLAVINGKPVGDHIGHTLREIIPELAPEIEAVVDRIFAAGEPVWDIETHGTAGGDPLRERDWLKSYYPVKSSDGITRYVGVVVLEITERKAIAQRAEVAASEARLKELANAMPQIVWTARPDGHVDYYNDRWYEFTGRPRDGGGDESWQSVLHPDDLQRCLDTWHAALHSGNSYEIEYRFKEQKTGCYRWHLGRALPVRDGGGMIVRWIGTCTDIDDQKRAAENLRQAGEELEERVQHRTVELWQAIEGFRRSEQRYRSLVEATTAIVWSTAASGEVESDLPSWAAFTGQSLEQIKGRGWLEAIHPEDRAKTASAWSASSAARSPYQMEHRVRRCDGEYRRMQARGVPIMDKAGTILEWVGAHVDVTEQKRAEEALSESERFARSTLDALSAHIAILDDKGFILATNKAWRDFASSNPVKADVGVGANYLDVCDLATGPCAKEAAAVAVGIRDVIREARGDFDLEYPCHSPSQQRWFLVRATRFTGDGPVRVVIAHENVTAAKLAEEERQKFVSLVENSTDFIGMATLSGEVIYTNAAACEMVGFDRTLSATVTRIPDYYTDAGKRVMEETVMPSVMSTGRWEGEVQFRNFRTGLPIETDSSVFMVRHPQSGEPLCIATVTRDITERKLQEQELHEVRAQLAARVRKLDALATIDGLTGIANRRTFQARLEAECARSDRDNAPLALMLLDIDRFKSLNDTYGHSGGDEVLTMMGRVLASSSRNTDLVARFGGEEFAVILINTEKAAASGAAERLRTRIEAEHWPHHSITVSIGIALWGPGTLTAAELINQADQALYSSKEHGRNRTTLAS